MTLKEAIKHCKEKAEEQRGQADYYKTRTFYNAEQQITDCLECASQHEQLAQWLSELYALKELNKDEQYVRGYDDGYADAQREFKRSGKA